METLAHVHCVSAYDAALMLESVTSGDAQPLFQGLNGKKFSTQVGLALLPLAIVLGVLGSPQQAQANYGCGYGSPALQCGSRGSQVASIQRRLKQLNYFNGPVTGYYGPITIRAVKAFQRDYGLKPDGVVGSQTRAALFAEDDLGYRYRDRYQPVTHYQPVSPYRVYLPQSDRCCDPCQR